MPQSLVVSIPAGQAVEAKPTGIVFNGSSDFVVSDVGRSGPARFIFAGQAGTLAAGSPALGPSLLLWPCFVQVGPVEQPEVEEVDLPLGGGPSV